MSDDDAHPPIELPSKLVPHVFERKGIGRLPSGNQVLQGFGMVIGALLCLIVIMGLLLVLIALVHKL